uniref:Ig-like domain-containing protein n=1 Tax=Fundulus heteroclitus TaxID=8078 RepID=A0A3Q2PZX6_FUNHE
VPVKSVHLGESVTFKCALPNDFNQGYIYWYKQRPRDTLRLVVTQRKTGIRKFEPEFSDSKWDVNIDQEFSRLTLLRTTYDDDGVYHCALLAWTRGIEWSGTYLIVIGITRRISNYTVVQQPALSNPAGSGDTATLQCSVLLDTEDMACSEDLSLFWFQSKSDKSYPNVIYTEGNRHDQCKKRSDTERSCVFQFSKAVNSSDAGMFYCAVASCGKILFGNGTRLEIGMLLPLTILIK